MLEKHIGRFKKHMVDVVKRYSFFYALFGFFFFLIHLVSVSVAAFFHFNLGHRFSDIEDWVFNNGWIIVSIAKGLAFYFVLKILKTSHQYEIGLRRFLATTANSPSHSIFVAVLFLFTFLVRLGRPQLTEFMPGQLFSIAISYFGNLFYLFFDLLLLSYLRHFSPILGDTEKKYFYIVNFLLFTLFHTVVASYQKDFEYYMYIHLFTVFVLFEVSDGGWVLPFVYSAVFAAPANVLFGMDPLWSDLYAPLAFSRKPSTLSCLVIWGTAIFYLAKSYRRSSVKSWIN